MIEAAQESLSLLDLRGVGPELARKLQAFGVRTPADLAVLYPRAYKDWRFPTPIARLLQEAFERSAEGPRGEAVEDIVLGTILAVRSFRGKMSIMSAQVDDGSGVLRAVWFGRKGLRLKEGERIFLHGRVACKRAGGRLEVEMNVLHHRMLREGESYAGSVIPVYPAGKELPSRVLAALIERNLDTLAGLLREVVPGDILAEHKYAPLREAWRNMHAPETPQAAAAARERVIYEEFFEIALAAAMKRVSRAGAVGATRLPMDSAQLLEEFQASLPFTLTGAQQRAILEIYGDMAQAAPMNRLLQGDVGSGKTLVAAAAVFAAARAGVQSALMAPTEILATQHSAKLAPLLAPLGITVEAVFASMGARERRTAEGRISSGEALLAVGTHALLTESVHFKHLGLVVIDEQHRFGVAQRAQLRAKGQAAHTLSMTATPIPRTLAQTKFADFDLCIIDELPPGRTPIDTRVLHASRKFRAYEFIRKNVALGRQAYVVAPAIDESQDESQAALTSAVKELEALQREVFPDLRVALLHGRMAARKKEEVMGRFARAEIDVLLATTVIEVGVDVPNAAVMVVLDAHRYGLAQLHQLRGRVGRGAQKSYCILIAPDEENVAERLEILASTTDGFEIAEHDMRLRGAGKLDGTAQAGQANELLGDFVADFGIYKRAKEDADELVRRDPQLDAPEHRALRSLLTSESELRSSLVCS